MIYSFGQIFPSRKFLMLRCWLLCLDAHLGFMMAIRSGWSVIGGGGEGGEDESGNLCLSASFCSFQIPHFAGSPKIISRSRSASFLYVATARRQTE